MRRPARPNRSATVRGPVSGGRHSEGEVPLNRRLTTSIAAAACALAAGAGAVALATPDSHAAARSSAELSRARAQVAHLRAQIRRERRLHRAALSRAGQGHPVGAAVNHALSVAAATYGVPLAKLRRVATCESTLNPLATNGQYAGLFQFGTPLWNATPYGRFPRTDPYAASLAAAWAFKRGMSRHWPICGRG